MSIFNGIIGQDRAKGALNFSLDGYKQSRFFPPTILTGSRGFGKTSIAKALKGGLLNSQNKPKTFIEVNGATAKNVGPFILSIVVPYLVDKESILFLDEIHAASIEVRRWLLSALPTGRETVTRVRWGEDEFTLDWQRINLIAATTNIETLSVPLRDRFERIDLEPYSDGQLIQILKLKSKNINYSEDIEKEIVKTCRHSPRLIEKRADKIIKYCEIYKKNGFGNSEWADLFKMMGFYPLGLNANEVEHLKLLRNGPLTLTNLAAKLGLDATTVRRDIESYLHLQGLITIDGKRALTGKGVSLINNL